MHSLPYGKPEQIKPAPIVDKSTGRPVINPATGKVALCLKCERANCQTELPVDAIPENRRAAFAEASGFVQYQDRVFCSRGCLEMEAKSPSGPRLLSPRDQKASTRVTRVSVRRVMGHDGEPRFDIVCDRHDCATRARVAGNADTAKILQAATAAGFVEAHHGTYCSHGCERMVRSEIARGVHPAHQFGTTRVASVPVAEPGHVPVAPPAPAAAPPPVSTVSVVAAEPAPEPAQPAAEPAPLAREPEPQPRWQVQRHGGRRRNG